MTKDGWIDVRDALPEDGKAYVIATVDRDEAFAKYRGRSRPNELPHWAEDRMPGRIWTLKQVTHYMPRPALPPPPRPRGPFRWTRSNEIEFSGSSGTNYLSDLRLANVTGERMAGWLNGLWAKRESE